MSAEKPSGNPLVLAQGSRLRFRHLGFLDILGKTRNLRLTAEQMDMTQPAATKVLMDPPLVGQMLSQSTVSIRLANIFTYLAGRPVLSR
jgi:hypothetical protein